MTYPGVHTCQEQPERNRYNTMSNPIWPVVAENLAEQLAAAQGGRVHPVQLLPFLPLSLQQVEGILDELCETDRVNKEASEGLLAYTFNEYLDRPPVRFNPQQGVYSNEPLDKQEFSAVCPQVRDQIHTELGILAEQDPWPGDAVWQHEIIYLLRNLQGPVFLSSVAGHSRMSFKKVEERMNQLIEMGAVSYSESTKSYELPPLDYPKPAYKRHDAFIRQFPGALKEEMETRILKALMYTLFIAVMAFVIAITAKIPFPLLLVIAGIGAGITSFRVIFAKPKPLPRL